MRNEVRSPVRLWIVTCAWLAVAGLAPGQHDQTADFAVDTRVYAGQSREPALVTVTLFQPGRVYDILQTPPGEIALFDMRRQQIELLDPKRQVTSQISFADLLQFVARVESWARRETGLIRFAAVPAFEEDYASTQRMLSFSSEQLIYRVILSTPDDDEIAARYRQFADWSARLGATNPSVLPPAARLRINAMVAARQAIPATVSREIRDVQGRPDQKLRSQHQLRSALTARDRELIARVERHRQEFDHIPFLQYRNLHKVSVADRPGSRNSAK